MLHKVVLHMTLEEAWTHVNIDVSTFRAFVGPSQALILHENCKAMEMNIQPLIFVGYYKDIKEDRLFDHNYKYDSFWRDVHFDDFAYHANSFVFLE